jgi:UDPglucose 6-dehydrogenase
MKQIAILGTGYVGLVTGTCFAELGNMVVCLDNDVHKIAVLKRGEAPFYEPQLLEMITRNQHAGRLSFSTDIQSGIQGSEIVFIAVGTPMHADGSADLSAVRAAAAAIGQAINGPKIVVSKSTVPVETGEMVSAIIAENSIDEHQIDVVSNPEFLREGSAVSDFMQPDRIVIGTSSPQAEAIMRDLYASLDAPFVVTDVRTSEMIKYAANAFLATKISFMNEIANICEIVNVDVKAVGRGIGFDHRIGTQFMNPGIGYGGSCFPKDVRALEKIANARNYDATLLRSVETINRDQIKRAFAKIEDALNSVQDKTIAILGLAFKPNTDDTRESPAIHLINMFVGAGAHVRTHDPIAIDGIRERKEIVHCEDVYETIHGSDAIVLATEWNEYKNLDFHMVRKVMRGTLVFDGRNIFDPDKVVSEGLQYIGVGRTKQPAFSYRTT